MKINESLSNFNKRLVSTGCDILAFQWHISICFCTSFNDVTEYTYNEISLICQRLF